MYGLFPSEAGQTSGVTKAKLCSLHDSSFRWPSEETVCPDTLPALTKNIAVNFMEHFFKGEGRALVRREVERMKPQVIVCASLYYETFFITKNPLTSGWHHSAPGQG